ncbi:Two-component response regulator, FixJ family, consists of REC and HTH domains [Bosea lupini]|uniref:Two-component response regulator, FixJ family, consists of REC and HTH domains n=1 Tax=Bosea lupini TaxID=1036779 RepID=A0A1H7T1W3_9HYPH|nr:response regulator [Bosea lupini]SEL78489.1 Two-component response regulator, FixJ family, consists of REC and HTH domains [Bosea lupini]
MDRQPATVFVVDDDVSVREGLDSLLRSVGYAVSVFASVREFALARRPDTPSCLVLDVRMPGPSGMDFQAELATLNDPIPIVFLTGHGDVPMAVRAIKLGAVEFLLKPFREQDLLDAVRVAIGKDEARRKDEAALAELKERFATLTVREKEVLTFVAQGRLNKQIAADLGLSEVTVKVHRGQVMRKMGASTLAELVRLADLVAGQERAIR